MPRKRSARRQGNSVKKPYQAPNIPDPIVSTLENGGWVAILNGKVIDEDESGDALSLRMERRRLGAKVIYAPIPKPGIWIV